MAMVTAMIAGFFAVQELKPQTIWPGFGVNIHFTEPVSGEIEKMQAAGFQYARMDFTWQQTEKEQGNYNFSSYDRLLANLKKAGIKPLWILSYGNPIYQTTTPNTLESRAAFSRWAAAAVNHFKGEQILWEIWNEPNLDTFWIPKSDPDAYRTLAVETALSMKEADPSCRVIAPGVSGTDFPFLTQVLTKELLSLVDGVSIHPYRTSGPETVWDDFGRLRALIKAAAPDGRKNLPIISSEWGYSTFTKGVSEERQALYATKMWLINSAAGVPVSIFYDWKDDGSDPAESENRFGMVKQDLTSKPSYTATKQLLKAFSGCTVYRRLSTKDPLDWIIVGGGPNKLVQARWYQKRADLPQYKLLNLTDKSNKRIHSELMGATTSSVAVAKPPNKPNAVKVPEKPVRVSEIQVDFAPPLEKSGWTALIQKPYEKAQKVEFKYTRKATGAKVTCFCKADGPRDSEELACNEPELTISASVGESPIRTATLKRVQFESDSLSNNHVIDNALTRQENISATTEGFTLSYTFGLNSKATTVTPKQETVAPDGAKKLIFWLKSESSPHSIGARFRDELGNVFEVSLGTLNSPADRNGWRILLVPLDGSGVTTVQGANPNLKPVGRITWEAILVIRNSSVNTESSGVIEVGSAAYEF